MDLFLDALEKTGVGGGQHGDEDEMGDSMNGSNDRLSVLITGAAKRLGRDIALELAQNHWNIAIHYNTSAAQAQETAARCREFGVQAIAMEADLKSEASVRALFKRADDHFGGLDAVVNSASMFENDVDLNHIYAALESHIQVNLAAPLLLSSLLFEGVQKSNKKGCVVNLLDQKLWNSNPDFISYSASKAALKFCVAMLAQKFAPHVRINGVAPGLSYPSYLQTSADFERASKYSLLDQQTNPVDVAKAVRFLLENQSVTGSHLIVDAGQHLTPMGRDVSFL